ncbi:MAG TPA: carbohydrate-binding protein [Clostridiales bacterium]|nr:carbohydrate-binding protein [Clostridiales bacterium]
MVKRGKNMSYNDFDTGVHITPAPVTSNEIVEVSYSGILSKNGAKELYLHYGSSYLEDWANVSDTKMSKDANGVFSANLSVPVGNKLNLCFRDTAYNWDNNNGKNYIYEINK